MKAAERMEIVFRNVHLSYQEYAAVNWQYAWRQQKLKLLIFPAMFVVFIVLNLRSPSPAAYPSTPTQSALLYAASSVVFVALVVFVLRRSMRQRYDRTQFLQHPATYTFTEAGIRMDAPQVQGFNGWDTLGRLFVMKHLAILTTKNLTVYFLDFRCLEAPATQADFLALLQRHQIPTS